MNIAAPAGPSDIAAPPLPSPSPSDARTLAVVVAIGALVAALTWRAFDAGPGWFAADALLVLALLAGVGRASPGGSAWLLGAVSVWLAAAAAWHASDWAFVTALPGSVAALGALALVVTRRTPAARLADVVPTALAAVKAVPSGFVDAARAPGRALGSEARATWRSLGRGLLLGSPLGILFTVLLAADRAFREALLSVLSRSGDGLELVTWTGGIVGGLLVSHAVLRRVAPPPGDADLTPRLPPYRGPEDASPLEFPVLALEAPPAPRVAPLTWAMVLAQVSAVFAVYVGANARSLFAGHERLRAPGTWTYAGYVHEGFIQVSVAALLAVACVVSGHALLRPRGGAGPVGGGRRLAALELGLLSLVGVTLVSCAHRLSLYEEAYGYTYLRLGVWLLQLMVAGLLAMTVTRCLARGWRGWGSALGWSAVAFTALAGSFDADGWIARHNAARAREGRPLDIGYLASLSEDALPALPEIRAVDPRAAFALEQSWGGQAVSRRARGWRTVRGASH